MNLKVFTLISPPFSSLTHITALSIEITAPLALFGAPSMLAMKITGAPSFKTNVCNIFVQPESTVL